MPAGKPRQINSQLKAARAHSKTLPRRQEILSRIFFAAERMGGQQGLVALFRKIHSVEADFVEPSK